MPKSRTGEKKYHVEKQFDYTDYSFNLSRRGMPISDEEVEKVAEVEGVDTVYKAGRYTITFSVARIYDTDDVVKRVKKVLGCG